MPYNNHCCAGVAHLVERDLAKVEVASSSLVARSKKKHHPSGWCFFFGQVGQRLERARAQREKHAGGMFWCLCACGDPAGPPASLVAHSKKHHPSRVVFFFGVSKTPRRVCRPQAAKNRNHFSPRHVRGEKYLSDCKCGILPLAAKLCAQQAAILLSEKPGGFFDSLTTALGTLLFCAYFSPCGVPKGRVSTSGSRRMRRKSWQKAAYS